MIKGQIEVHHVLLQKNISTLKNNVLFSSLSKCCITFENKKILILYYNNQLSINFIMFIRKNYWENSKKAQVHIKPIMPIMQYSFHANYELQLVAQVSWVIRN